LREKRARRDPGHFRPGILSTCELAEIRSKFSSHKTPTCTMELVTYKIAK
jgi:hypothetical protein